jgi:RHS repeat-associated protein
MVEPKPVSPGAGGEWTSTSDPTPVDGHPFTKYEYDAAGNRTKVLEPDIYTTSWTFATTTYSFDALGRQVSETDANGDVTKFAYDRVGNLVSLLDAEGNETSWQYDSLDRATGERNTFGYSRLFTYDAVGNLTQAIDRNGRKITYGHDRLDRSTSEQWFVDINDPTPDRTFSFSYDLSGRMTNSNDPYHYYTYQFDPLDRLGSVEEWLIGMNVPVKFTTGYDTASNKRTEVAAIDTWWNDYYNTIGVDGLGRVTNITQQWLGAHAVANKRVDFGYDLAGQRDWVKRYASTGTTNAVASTDYAWDGAGRLSTIDHRQGSSPGTGTLAGYGYSWNQRQQLTGIDFLPNGSNSPFNYSAEDVSLYDYDARGQLISANYTTQPDENYQWDDNGNRTNGGFTPGVNNRLVNDGTYSYTYDNEGNITKRTKISGADSDGTKTREFSWDHRNRLVKVTNKNASNGEINRVEYAYDGDDHMIRRQVFLGGSSTPSLQQVFAYSDGQITLQFEKTGGGALTRTDLAHRYLWGPAVDELLADEDINSLTNAAQNTVLWPLSDHLGTVRDWLDSAANVVDHVEYNSFGKRIDTTVAVDAAFGWTGRYRDPLTGLQYNNARWYDPAVGRWLIEDPIGFAAGDASLSRYVQNAPTVYVDPSGLAESKYRYLPDPDRGKWSDPNKPGDSIFHFNDPALPSIRYKGGVPDLSQYVYDKDGIEGVVEIDYSCDLTLSDKKRRKADIAAANKAMKEKYPKWESDSNYVWHHQYVNPRTGRGQMILVKRNVHEAARHEGAFSFWTKYLEAKEAGNRKALTNAGKALRTMGIITTIGRKAAGPLALVCAADIARMGYANGGIAGAGDALIRDMMFADEIESLLGPGIGAVHDRYLPENASENYRDSQRRNLQELLEPYRERDKD